MAAQKIIKLDTSRNNDYLREVIDRGEDRRQEQRPYAGQDQRVQERRQSEQEKLNALLEEYKQEAIRLRIKNEDMAIPVSESALWYSSIALGFTVIFGWMAVLIIFG